MADQIIRMHGEGYVVEITPGTRLSHVILRVINLKYDDPLPISVQVTELVEFANLVRKQYGE